MADETPKPKFKRRPLGRTLGKRRLGKKDGDEEEARSGEDAPDSDAKEDSSPSPGAEDDPAEDSTLPLPNAGSPGAALTPEAGPTLGEQASVRKAAIGRFFKEFGAFTVEFVQWVASGGKKSWRSVVLPFSKALVDAAVSMCLILITLAIGILLGRYLHPVLDPPVETGQRGHPFPVTSTPLPTTNPDPTATDARAALERFLEAIDGRAYQAAYSLLSPGWRKELPYSTFEQGFAPTDSIRFNIKEAVPLGQDRVQLEVGLEVVENGNPRRYSGTYVAVKTAEGWRLDSGSLR